MDEAVETQGAEPSETVEKPKRRGRPKGSGRKKATETDAESDVGSNTAPKDRSNNRSNASDGVAEATEVEEEAPKKTRGRKKSKPEPDEVSARAEDADQSDDDESDDQDEEKETRQVPRRGRGRSQRSGRRQSLNYRDLQSKILPELHLLAKEVGLLDYRQMDKDALSVAILERSSESEGLKLVKGYLEISSDGYGFLQESLLQNNTRSVIVSAGLIKQFKLRTGDFILGKSRKPRDNERYGTLIRVEAVNGVDPFQAAKRPRFDDLIPTFPEERIRLETTQNEVAARVIDLLAPIGRGQRGLIVAPPKAGKTTLLKKIANSVVTNEPDITVIVLLVDERPEEVTDFRESVSGVEVIASTFDEPPTNHIRVAEFVHERSRRIVEEGGHVMILLDSITRLARANNLVTPPTGRTLSGGLDSSALPLAQALFRGSAQHSWRWLLVHHGNCSG